MKNESHCRLRMKPFVLIVDDILENLQVLGNILMEEGFDVTAASSANETLDLLKGVDLPDIILLDIMMPGMDGIQLCEILKSDSRLNNLPVIFLTAKNDLEDIVKGFTVGGADYITKPFHRQELLVRVKTHLELKYLKEELIIKNRYLKAANHELKEAMSNLQKVNLELDKSNSDLEAFSHTVAHDLKNPLSVIIGCADLTLAASGKEDDTEILEYITFIKNIGIKMNTIIDSLLLLAGIQKYDNVPTEVFNMEKIIDESLYRLKNIISDKGAVIEKTNSLPDAAGYPDWVEEIWVNYIHNALKYGGSPPEIRLSADRLDSGHVCYSVTDNGAGLTEEECEKLFAPFARLKHVAIEGHGLGLSIVRRIVEKLGGEAGVQSSQGKGCTFWFTLPAGK